MLSNEVFSAPLKADALGVWLYLLSKPEDWIVVPKQLQERFSMGRDAMRRVFRELQDYGVMVRAPKQGDAGKLSGWEYIVYEVPNAWKSGERPPNDGISVARSTERLENRTTGEPSDGKSVPLQRTDSLQSTESYKGSRQVPEDWVRPDQRTLQFMGVPPNVNLDRAEKLFRLHDFKSPVQDFDRRFATWCIRESTWNTTPKQQPSGSSEMQDL